MPSLESKPEKYTKEFLQSTFKYDKSSGAISLRRDSNYKSANEPLGILDNGYVVILYDNHYIFAHRLAFMLVNGCWPEFEVDHINRVKSDNSWDNLRLATRYDNIINRGLRKDNSTGISGVSIRRNGSFRVRIDGKRLGDVLDFFEACCIRKSAESKSVIRQQLAI